MSDEREEIRNKEQQEERHEERHRDIQRFSSTPRQIQRTNNQTKAEGNGSTRDQGGRQTKPLQRTKGEKAKKETKIGKERSNKKEKGNSGTQGIARETKTANGIAIERHSLIQYQYAANFYKWLQSANLHTNCTIPTTTHNSSSNGYDGSSTISYGLHGPAIAWTRCTGLFGVGRRTACASAGNHFSAVFLFVGAVPPFADSPDIARGGLLLSRGHDCRETSH